MLHKNSENFLFFLGGHGVAEAAMKNTSWIPLARLPLPAVPRTSEFEYKRQVLILASFKLKYRTGDLDIQVSRWWSRARTGAQSFRVGSVTFARLCNFSRDFHVRLRSRPLRPWPLTRRPPSPPAWSSTNSPDKRLETGRILRRTFLTEPCLESIFLARTTMRRSSSFQQLHFQLAATPHRNGMLRRPPERLMLKKLTILAGADP